MSESERSPRETGGHHLSAPRVLTGNNLALDLTRRISTSTHGFCILHDCRGRLPLMCYVILEPKVAHPKWQVHDALKDPVRQFCLSSDLGLDLNGIQLLNLCIIAGVDCGFEQVSGSCLVFPSPHRPVQSNSFRFHSLLGTGGKAIQHRNKSGLTSTWPWIRSAFQSLDL